jgi:polar amino acid transport system substrate-binding protein
LLGIAALAVTLAACGGGKKTTTTKPKGVPTLSHGTLIVGFDLPAPSFWNGQASGTTLLHPSGFEYSLAVDVARQMGIPKASVALLRAPFQTILLHGEKPFDFAMEETTITPERAKVIGFSDPYFDANQGVLIAKGVPKPTSIADLKSLHTCAQANTTGLDWILHKLRPTSQPNVYSASSSAAFDAVAAGTCQALILDLPIIEAQAAKQPHAYGGVVGQIDTKEGYGAVFFKESALIPYVNKALAKLKSNGTIGELTKRWFGFDPTTVPVLK